MKSLIISLNCVAPIFIMLIVGLLIRKSGMVPEEMFHQLSTVCFNILIPSQIFYNIYCSDLNAVFSLSLMGYLAAWEAIWFFLNYAFFTWRDPDPRTRGVYIQCAFRTNIAVVGVSLAKTMMDGAGVAAVTMATALLIPIYNVLAVFTLETCRGQKVHLNKTLKAIGKNPLIWSCVVGIVCVMIGFRLPDPLERSIRDLGTAGGAMTLISLGASLKGQGLVDNRRKLVGCNLLRLLIAPASALVPAFLFGFKGNSIGTILICTATPMATTAFPMALACESDYELTGQVVITTSLFCCITLFLWIFALKASAIL